MSLGIEEDSHFCFGLCRFEMLNHRFIDLNYRKSPRINTLGNLPHGIGNALRATHVPPVIPIRRECDDRLRFAAARRRYAGMMEKAPSS